ncbi:RagB/SusD family nutrient uptake outer membrane protein [Chitinophaga sp. Mgbs1]|uniref:RagB/SusD family nutrient uptake outer membrane protein n=1 Tax=Chitinophaga solisilvae TaxID=1233460 RepID=A0A9Q5D328_9BACT|nr:RagB/SusD family nutrient uptake outer membrane protein [Chitinophaga solisilvae]
MKHTYLLYLMMGSGIFFSSCKKGFLDIATNENISKEQVFSSLDFTERFVNNIYTGIPNGFDRVGEFVSLNALSDEGEPTFKQQAKEFNGGGYNASYFPVSSPSWANTYKNIRKTNLLLANIGGVPANGEADEQLKQRLRGEALFLRSFFYFDLLKFFGPFIISDRPLDVNENLQLPRNSYDECVAFLEKSLDEAIKLLPVTFDAGTGYGRATKGMCMALKSRLLLYAASPLNSADNAARWQKAAAAAKAVIDLNAYALYTKNTDKVINYQQIFQDYGNPELIMSLNFGAGKSLEQAFFPPGNSGWGNTVPTQEMADAYETSDGLLITDPGSVYNAARPYENRDPRFYASVLYHGQPFKGRKLDCSTTGIDGIRTSNNATTTGYYLRKYINENINLNTGAGRTMYWVWFRLAEMYLNYAEAANEAAANPSQDPLIYTYINLIRARSGMPALPAGLDKAAMRKRIRHERQIELAFEEHRFFDIRRWKTGETHLNGYTHGIEWTPDGSSYKIVEVFSRIFQQKMYYMPIPQSEVDKDKQLQQNNGW